MRLIIDWLSRIANPPRREEPEEAVFATE